MNRVKGKSQLPIDKGKHDFGYENTKEQQK